jgi:hypothetical protein
MKTKNPADGSFSCRRGVMRQQASIIGAEPRCIRTNTDQAIRLPPLILHDNRHSVNGERPTKNPPTDTSDTVH